MLALASFTFVNAQSITDRCGENYTIQTFNDAGGNYQESRNQFYELTDLQDSRADKPEGVVYTIPVVFHVIYENDVDNISREQILDQLRVINRDYRRLNPDTVNTRAIFKGVAADAEIEFAIANLDPQGNCTDGITRTYSTLTGQANNNVKPLVNWDNKKYLNIWVVRAINLPSSQGTTLGYAYKPSINQSYIFDGIVIRHDQVGTIGTSNSYGRTLVHEAGHYLGLDHPFNNGCNNGDNCGDTPPVANPSFGCDLNTNSCHNDSPDLVDQIENYMDYADDDCTNMFTACQVNRMRNSLGTSFLRGYLVTASNALATGIQPNQNLPCAPKADFYAEPTLLCEGNTVQFNDLTYYGNATSYQWNFPGGTPSSSTQPNPTVTYNQKGIYDATLTVSNSHGTNNLTKYKSISIRSLTNTPYINAFGDNFENYPIPNENWAVNNSLDTIDFRYFTKTAFAGQSCVTLQNFNAIQSEVDEMISHTISLENSKEATLLYQYAFAEKSIGNNDKLLTYISDDCGQTWTLVKTQLGPLLRTVSAKITTSWWPTSSSDWKQGTLDLSAYALSPTPIMIKFEFTGGGGNNLYLDEILLATTIGTKELFADEADLKIYPNPAQSYITIETTIDIDKIEIKDLSGRVILNKVPKSGERTNDVSIADLSSGVYLVTVYSEGVSKTKKVVVQ